MRRSVALAVLCALTAFHSNAQPVVDQSTGALQFSIPLFNVVDGPLSVPVSINYNRNGIRVNEPEGSGGMGWNLAADGAVVRDLRGLPDDFVGSGGDNRRGWLSSGVASAIQGFNPTTNDNYSDCLDERADFNFLNGRQLDYDTEPDVFSFYAPGLSGSFVFDASGNPQLMPYQDLNIAVVTTSGRITSIIIKNNQGITYTFDVVETMTRTIPNDYSPTAFVSAYNYYHYYGTETTFTLSWKLRKIASIHGDEINFTYAYNDVAFSSRKIETITQAGVITLQYIIEDEIQTQQLQTIQSDWQTLSFSWLGAEVWFIEEVRTGTPSKKTFLFEYLYTYDDADTSPALLDRKSFLWKITEMRDCNPYPSFVFGYWNLTTVDLINQVAKVPLGFHNDVKKDLWGYYNGTSTTNIPDIYYNASANDAERFRVLPVALELSTYTGAQRVANVNTVMNGSLYTIQYPEGGQHTITWEANQFYDAAASANKYGAGARVKTITMSGGAAGSLSVVDNYEYTQSNGTTSSGKLNYPPVFALPDGTEIMRVTDNLGPDSYVLYERSVHKQANRGKTVFNYSLPAMYPATSSSPDWTATRSKVARFVETGSSPTCQSIGNLVNGYYAFPWPAQRNFDFETGLLTSIVDYSETGAKVSEKTYTYSRLSTTAVSIKGVRFEPVYGAYVFGQYSLLANVAKPVSQEVSTIADEVTPGSDAANPTNTVSTTTSYHYSTTHQMLDLVTVTNSDAASYETAIKYPKDYASSITNPEPTDLFATAIKSLNDNRMYGTPILTKKSRIGSSTDVIEASMTLFKSFGIGYPRSHKSLTYPNTTGYTDPTVTTNGSGKHIVGLNANFLGTEILSYYDAFPESVQDYKNQKSGVHFDHATNLPVAQITNALANEVVYDGFEGSYSNGFGGSVTTSSTAFAGSKGAPLPAANWFTKNGVSKSGSKYKASAWVYGTVATTITFKISDPSNSDTKTASYSTPNKWQFLEVFLDASSIASSTFAFRFETVAGVNVDEILLHPIDASVTMTSYDNAFGKVAVTNERGDAAFVAYDALGRVKHTMNKNRDLLHVNEYKLANETVPPVNANFSMSTAESNFRNNTAITFTPGTNCSTVSGYQWKVNGSNAGTGSTLTYTPTTTGLMTVGLTVTLSTGATATSSQSFCVSPLTMTTSITTLDLDGQTGPDLYKYGACKHRKKITATALGGCFNSGEGNGTVSYGWSYKPDGGTDWLSVPAIEGNEINGNQLTFGMIPATGYTIKCTIAMDCNTGQDCPSDFLRQEQIMHFTKVTQTGCM